MNPGPKTPISTPITTFRSGGVVLQCSNSDNLKGYRSYWTRRSTGVRNSATVFEGFWSMLVSQYSTVSALCNPILANQTP